MKVQVQLDKHEIAEIMKAHFVALGYPVNTVVLMSHVPKGRPDMETPVATIHLAGDDLEDLKTPAKPQEAPGYGEPRARRRIVAPPQKKER